MDFILVSNDMKEMEKIYDPSVVEESTYKRWEEKASDVYASIYNILID